MGGGGFVYECLLVECLEDVGEEVFEYLFIVWEFSCLIVGGVIFVE